MTEFLASRQQIYQSAGMADRRRKILQETRRLIRDQGANGFSIREICDRAEVSQKTIYNNFGSKEGLMAAAVFESLKGFHESGPFHFDGNSLEGRLERLIKVRNRNIEVRPYAVALMTIYNSTTLGLEVREAMRNASKLEMQQFAEHLERNNCLAPGVTAATYLENNMLAGYALLTEWALGSIKDDDVIDRSAEMFLVLLAASTKGSFADEARIWLEDVRTKRPGWRSLCSIATSSAAFSQ